MLADGWHDAQDGLLDFFNFHEVASRKLSSVPLETTNYTPFKLEELS